MRDLIVNSHTSNNSIHKRNVSGPITVYITSAAAAASVMMMMMRRRRRVMMTTKSAKTSS